MECECGKDLAISDTDSQSYHIEDLEWIDPPIEFGDPGLLGPVSGARICTERHCGYAVSWIKRAAIKILQDFLSCSDPEPNDIKQIAAIIRREMEKGND